MTAEENKALARMEIEEIWTKGTSPLLMRSTPQTTPATNPRALRTYAVWRPSSSFNPYPETQKGRV